MRMLPPGFRIPIPTRNHVHRRLSHDTVVILLALAIITATVLALTNGDYGEPYISF